MKEKLKDYKDFNILHLTDDSNSGSFSRHFSFGTFDLENPGNHIDVYPYVQMSKHQIEEGRYMNELILNVFGMNTSPDAQHFSISDHKGEVLQIAILNEDLNLVQRRFLLISDSGSFKIGLQNDPESFETFTWKKLAGDHVIRVEHSNGSVIVDEKAGPILQNVDAQEQQLRDILKNENVPASVVLHIEKKIAALRAQKNSCLQ